jgi:hypothetical protein
MCGNSQRAGGLGIKKYFLIPSILLLPKVYGGLLIMTPYGEGSCNPSTCRVISVEDWYRQSRKYSKGSIVRKYLVYVFPLVGQWAVWKISNGRKVRVGNTLGWEENDFLAFKYPPPSYSLSWYFLSGRCQSPITPSQREAGLEVGGSLRDGRHIS